MECHDQERGGEKVHGIEEIEKLGSHGRHLKFVFDIIRDHPLVPLPPLATLVHRDHHTSWTGRVDCPISVT